MHQYPSSRFITFLITCYPFLESTSLDDDWEKDFDDDIEVTEEDMRLAAEAAKKLAESGATVDDGNVSVNYLFCRLISTSLSLKK